MNAKRVQLILLSIYLSLVTGCAPTLNETFKKVEGTPENKALVYIYRTSGLGSLVYYDVKANGRIVTTLYSGTYYPYLTDPGEIEFSAKTEASDSVTLDVKPGQIYYLKGTVGVGFLVGHPHLTMVNQQEAEQEISDCKLLPEQQ